MNDQSIEKHERPEIIEFKAAFQKKNSKLRIYELTDYTFTHYYYGVQTNTSKNAQTKKNVAGMSFSMDIFWPPHLIGLTFLHKFTMTKV